MRMKKDAYHLSSIQSEVSSGTTVRGGGVRYRAKKEMNEFTPQVNLMPERFLVMSPEQNRKKGLMMFIWASLAVFLTAGAHLFLDIQGKKASAEISRLNYDIQKINDQIRLFDATKQDAERLQKQFVTAEKLLDSHLNWSFLFQFLEQNTLHDVFYTEMSIDGNDVRLVAAGPTYRTVARQIQLFQTSEKAIAGLGIGKANQVKENVDGKELSLVKIDLKLSLRPDILMRKETAKGQ
ncbi:MAG: hypothetical protein HY453_00405 [Parcubacteria group bacterium]|nr:hypothetical protein [Parcubacteria group bacterium]